jgi:hypothetical protein
MSEYTDDRTRGPSIESKIQGQYGYALEKTQAQLDDARGGEKFSLLTNNA